MEKIILIFIVFLSFNINTVQSQIYYPIPDTNVIWNVYNTNVSSSNVNGRWQYGIIGDTIINLKEYNKVYLLGDTSLNINTAGYYASIREENKIVYATDIDIPSIGYVDEEIIVYDFNLEVGDTFLVDDNFYNYYNHAIVQYTDSVTLLDNTVHRRIIFGGFPENYFWIEGVGSGKGILFPIIPFTTDGYEPLLSCMKYNDTALYINNNICGKCFCSGNIIDPNNVLECNEKYSIFPNPTTGKIVINIKNIEKIFIYNSKGQLINNSDKTDIDIGTYSKGLYFIKIITNNGIITKKILLK